MKNTQELLNSLSMLLDETSNEISMLANMSALLFYNITDINWVGFYLNQNNTLLLGPFQGKPACIEIPFTKGVCGTCASQQKTIVVPSVQNFLGHIACDEASKSELCIPVLVHKKLYAVLDIDSPILNRFQKEDEHFFEQAVQILSSCLERII